MGVISVVSAIDLSLLLDLLDLSPVSGLLDLSLVAGLLDMHLAEAQLTSNCNHLEPTTFQISNHFPYDWLFNMLSWSQTVRMGIQSLGTALTP